MKKFLVALVAMFCVTAVSAQVNNVGLRFNGGIELAGQYDLSKANYIDGRIGFGKHHIGVTGIYTWKIQEFNWTPQYGKWFFDAGVGGNIVIGNDLGLNVVGSAKLGFKFNNAPVSLIWDYCPSLTLTEVAADASRLNLWGGGVSIVYHF